MRVSVGLGGHCAAQTFLLVDRNSTRNPAQDLALVVSNNAKNKKNYITHDTNFTS